MKTTKNILFVSNVYPDANTTAAGKRTLQLMLLFVDENYKVSFASSSLKQSDQKVNLEQKNITCFDFQINDESFEKLIKENHFDMVVFDRFYTEEQVGWMVDMHLPGALKVLDMQDFHALRLSREEFYFQGIDYTPLSLYENQVAKRELASLHRCDFSLVISDYELNLLWRNFSIPQDKTLMLTMYYEKPEEQSPDYESRKDLLCVGNFLHKPNLEATRILKHTIWPKVRTKLPEVNLHLYGAYPTAEVQQMHQPSEGFLLLSEKNDLIEIYNKSRISLAPLPYGAGVKGKILEATAYGIPMVSSTMGIEGICSKNEFPGLVQDNWDDFAKAIVSLYTQKELWEEAREKSQKLEEKLLSNFENQKVKLLSKVENLLLTKQLEKHRHLHFTGELFKHQTLQSTMYLSKWIQEKNKP